MRDQGATSEALEDALIAENCRVAMRGEAEAMGMIGSWSQGSRQSLFNR